MKHRRNQQERQILGRVKHGEFIGRTSELERLVAHATKANSPALANGAQGLLILMAPLAGVSELLRQTFDSLFSRREEVIPIYFALPAAETTAVSAAIEFLNTFLLQYIAYRRDEPGLCHASLTLNDLLKLAPAADVEWIEELLEAYNQQRFGEDDRALVRFCLNAPARSFPRDARPFVMFDAVQLGAYADSAVPFALEIVRALKSGGNPFVLAGLRREVLDAMALAGGNLEAHEIMRVGQLGEEDARNLVSSTARRQQVSITEETRDLLVQQLECSPFFINAMLQAAGDKRLPLDSYLACERLYVDELMGGRLNRYFSSVLEHIAPQPQIRAAVVRLLCEATPQGKRSASVESWRKRLKLDSVAVEQLLESLHIHELVNCDGETIDVSGGSNLWRDYLKSRFRLDALREPRALVVADVIADALKRAPQTIAHHYRRAASLPLRELLGKFNSQRVPRSLFDFAAFAENYKGAPLDEVAAGLDEQTELMRLPQVVHTASGVSFSAALRQFGEESTVVAHAFGAGVYTNQNEVVWLVAKLESKLEADAALVGRWLDLLDAVARQSGIVKTQMWLIANEGFSIEASELLRERKAYGSSRQQFDLLIGRLSENSNVTQPADNEDEFQLIFPMGTDNEMLAASAVEQVARRLSFTPEAINQIKTAVVEACINASEHSLSPDRKIYQRFQVQNDRLVITISSRGILPTNITGNGEGEPGPEVESKPQKSDDRRGWGLKLIQTLMDEVEFERVDEGTSLRMTKYLRH
ncbi:MAG TPA: ATP-binding protein [Pyrinomonadaceae bacterium]|jgi:serine/threonine-protein kinase RsbW|nr:ATP-binding protein [Pyrinomonadaceae bacterium]